MKDEEFELLRDGITLRKGSPAYGTYWGWLQDKKPGRCSQHMYTCTTLKGSFTKTNDESTAEIAPALEFSPCLKI